MSVEAVKGTVERNTGISLLKLFLCFIVVFDHFHSVPVNLPQKAVNFFASAAVPGFIFISFYLTHSIFDNLDRDKIRKRFLRLAVPLAGWTLIYYVLESILNGTFLPPSCIIYGCLLGSSPLLDPPLWFLSSLILVCAVFTICFFTVRTEKERNVTLVILLAAAIFLQYSGANFYLFGSAPSELKYTLGRVVEIIPAAILGYFYGRYEKNMSARMKFLAGAVLLCLYVVLLNYTAKPEGFMYQGLPLLCLSSLMALFAINLPQIRVKPVASVINSCAKVTMGIFCLHFFIGQLFKSLGMSGTSLTFDLEVYLCSLLISLLLIRLSEKTKPAGSFSLLRYLFS